MSQATSDVFEDPILKNVSIKFSNSEFIAEQIFPTLTVEKRTGFYFTYDKSNLRVPKALRTGKAEAAQVEHGMTKTPYGPLQEHALKEGIEDDIMDQADDPIDPKTDATENVTEMLQLEKEDTLATTLADTAVVTQNVTLSGTSQWSDYSNSDPFADMETGFETVQKNSFRPPNTAFMGYQVFSKLKHHPDLLERVKYSERGVITAELLATLIGVDNVVIGRATKNTGKEGQTDASSYIWGKHFWLAYITPSAGLKRPTAGYHLQKNNARKVTEWDDRNHHCYWVEVSDYYEPKLVSVEAIYLIKNAVA